MKVESSAAIENLNEIFPILQNFLLPPTRALAAAQAFNKTWVAGSHWK
jgi:hypothetical protein